jgi:hypothetical protein
MVPPESDRHDTLESLAAELLPLGVSINGKTFTQKPNYLPWRAEGESLTPNDKRSDEADGKCWKMGTIGICTFNANNLLVRFHVWPRLSRLTARLRVNSKIDPIGPNGRG